MKRRRARQPRAERRAALAGGLIALPALLVVAASPVAAALPGRHWIEICSGAGVRWAPIDGNPAAPDRNDRHSVLCAHATCPREERLTRKPRRR